MSISRRQFIKVTATGAAVVAGCGGPSEPLDGDAADGFADGALPDARPDIDARAGADAGGASDAMGATDGAVMDTAPPACVADPVERGDAAAAAEFSAIDINGAGFPLGVMAGDPLDDRAVVWTRYDGARTVVLRVLQMDGAGGIVRVAFERAVTPTAAGFVHVDVTRLRPGTRYRFAFLERSGATGFSGRSRIGHFRTAPSDGACGVLTFGGASCNHRAGAPFAPLQRAADDDLAFFIHCGDHIYADEGANATNLAQYRAKYEAYWTVPGLKDLHASTGLFTTWDDHEVVNNWNPETIDDTDAGRTQLAAARRTFFEHRAFRRHGTVPDRIWRSFKWGRTAEIFMLDVRGERRPSTRATAGARFISATQMNWLKAGLSASTAVFKFVVTSKPITGRSAMDLERVDYWEGYPAQREELLNHVASNDIPGVWWLSGDVHYAAIARVEARGPYSAMREIYMGPAGSGDPGAVDCDPPGQFDTVIRRLNYARFRADPVARTLRVEFVDGAGRVICSRTYPA